MGWWVAEKGTATEFFGPTEISQDVARAVAIRKSQAKRGTVFQVRYRVNANGPVEVRWEALDGTMTEILGAAQKRP